MINVVLMAGRGQRFAEAGYKISKPLLPVCGKPMIMRAVECMPPADQWAFVVREEHLQEKEIIAVLKSVGKNVAILVDPNPIGQLNSCLVARGYLDRDEPIFIGACDFGMEYDRDLYRRIMLSSNRPDILVWSFTGQPNLARNPQAWGWLKQDEAGNIHGVSVKVPISADPIHDYAITGSFSFASGKDFLKIAEELMRREIKIKNEFYIDSMIGMGIEMGYKAMSFPVHYIGWGTPVDYEEYLWWEEAIRNPATHREAVGKLEYLFWKEYFERHA